MADPIISDAGEVFCPYPDCDRGPGGKPLASRIAYTGHERKHQAAERRAREAAERLAAAEAGDPIDKGKVPGPAAPLEKRMAASLSAIGMGAQILPLPVTIKADGRSLVNHSVALSDSAVALAAENETVRKACEIIAGGGAWGTFLITMITFLAEIAANHGWLRLEVPAPTPGATGEVDIAAAAAAFGLPPEVLGGMMAAMGQMFAPPGGGLKPEGANPDLTGPAPTSAPMTEAA